MNIFRNHNVNNLKSEQNTALDNINSNIDSNDSDDEERPTANFFTDLKNSPSLRIVTSLLIITLTFFIGMRFVEYRNEKKEIEYSLKFIATTEERTSKTEFVGLININTANLFELMQLKGIGEAKAKAIIDYRESEGPFLTIEDIMNVKGIGESIFNDIKNNITV